MDALTNDEVVLDEARQLARERGLPENWLNPNAKMWMPPLPEGVLDQPAEPGLRVTYAGDGFLFATKLIAQRAKDADDLVALAGRLGLLDATPDDLEHHIRRHYTNEADLEFIVDGAGVEREITMLARDASRMLSRMRRTHGAGSSETEIGSGATEERRQLPPPGRPPHSGPRR